MPGKIVNGIKQRYDNFSDAIGDLFSRGAKVVVKGFDKGTNAVKSAISKHLPSWISKPLNAYIGFNVSVDKGITAFVSDLGSGLYSLNKGLEDTFLDGVSASFGNKAAQNRLLTTLKNTGYAAANVALSLMRHSGDANTRIAGESFTKYLSKVTNGKIDGGKALENALAASVTNMYKKNGGVYTATYLGLTIASLFVSGGTVVGVGSKFGKTDELLGLAGKGEKVAKVAGDVKKENNFTGLLRGEKIVLKNIDTKPVEYVKRPSVEAKKLRNKFNASVKKSFLRNLATDEKRLQKYGLTKNDIEDMRDGYVPDGWQVHHQLPLDDSGTNDFSNLVLVKNEPYHKVITNYQRSSTKGMKPGDKRIINWPFIKNNIYNPK
ncbi:hypothetical protein EQG49_04245 [Periweissella cryptocerci]|uniref:Uncharacterized protein n=1 Tax=Periweissella cryptocerci TaxID=2506420 RepID=A0A4P6YSN5_9LACO|nr:HNH endonuclease signature motif containing protein [Periweissella cryptocerci]QBO35728.1 hypothetical protein EQG49_04245 [Periweissella cryptocerci]